MYNNYIVFLESSKLQNERYLKAFIYIYKISHFNFFSFTVMENNKDITIIL